MITTEPLADGALAVTVSGAVGADDVTRTFDAVRGVAGDKVHLLITVEQDMAPQWREALVAEWRRRTEVMALLRRAGRIAVVAPQAWVRAAAWIESLLIPGITYRIFRPEEAAAARAFVLGGEGGAV